MKVTLNNGTEIECTPQEFIMLKREGLLNDDKKQPSQVAPIIVPTHQSTHQPTHFNFKPDGWSDGDIRTLITFYSNKIGKYIKYEDMEMLKQLTGKTSDAIKVKACVLKKKGYIMKGNVTPTQPIHNTLFGRQPHINRRQEFTPEELQIVNTNSHLQLVEIAKLLKLKRSELQYIVNKKGGLRKIREKIGTKGTRILSDENRIKSSERMKYIYSRSKNLQQQYNYSWEKAFRFASTEWNEKNLQPTTYNKQIKSTTPQKIIEFPKFRELSSEGNVVFEQIVHNIIGIHGSISYKEIMYVALQNDTWTVNKWKEFVEDFMKNSSQVADSFSVPNKFKVNVGGNGYVVIKYGE